MMGLAVLLAAAAGWWAWKTRRWRTPRVGDVAAVVALLVGARFFSRGEFILAAIAFGGAGGWLWWRRPTIAYRTPGMNPERARALLEVDRSATDEEIRAAHRRIMRRVHPDVGGSALLATEINAARDALLATHVKR